MRWMRFVGLVTLLVVLPVGSHAGAPPAYHVVTGWPSGARGAPDYGTAAVSAVTTDAAGRVYVFQRTAHPLLIFDRDGKFLRAWGEGAFTSPHGCRVDPEDNLWLTDNADHRVMKWTTEGRLLATFGVRGEAGEDATHFNRPADVAFAPSGDVYIADGYGNSRVVRLSHDGRFLGAWGRKGKGEGEFNLPHSVAVDARGRVYAADRENARIQVFTPEGKFLSQWRDVGHPYGLCMMRDQRLFVTDGIANTVSVYDLEGKLQARWGSKGSAAGQFNLAHMITVDDRGAVYVTEIDGRRVQKFVAE